MVHNLDICVHIGIILIKLIELFGIHDNLISIIKNYGFDANNIIKHFLFQCDKN